MKVYFINLDRSPERRAWFTKQAEALGLDLVRVPAADGKELPAAELERLQKLSEGDQGRILSPGEIGCFLSHRKAWEMVRDGAEEWAFVAEDDIHFSSDAAAFMADDGWIPAQADLIKAETDLKRHEFSWASWPAPSGHELRRLKSIHLGSGGYFLTRGAAARLLAHTERRCEVIDGVLFATAHVQQHQLVVLQVMPAICIQDVYVEKHVETSTLASIIDWERDEGRQAIKRSIKFSAKLKRESRRVISQLKGLLSGVHRMLTRRSVFSVVDFDGPDGLA